MQRKEVDLEDKEEEVKTPEYLGGKESKIQDRGGA